MLLHTTIVSPIKGEWLVWCSRCEWSRSLPDWDKAMREKALHSVQEAV